MISIEEYNKRRQHKLREVAEGNGIACPSCGNELYHPQPNVILTTYPAQKRVACPYSGCDYVGSVLA